MPPGAIDISSLSPDQLNSITPAEQNNPIGQDNTPTSSGPIDLSTLSPDQVNSITPINDSTQIPRNNTQQVQDVQPEIIDTASQKQYNPTFPAQSGQENYLTAPLKVLGNMPSSMFGFVKGMASMFNPITIGKNIGADIQGFAQTAENFGGGQEGIRKAQASLISNLPGAAYETLVPEGARKFISAITGYDVNPNTLRVSSVDKNQARQQAMDAFINDPVGQVAPFLLVGKQLAEKAGFGEQFDNAVSSIANPVEKAATAPIKAIPPLARGVITQLSGLNPETLQAISDNPGEFTPEKMLNVSRKGLADEIQTELDKRAGALSETGQGYQPIRQGQTIVDESTAQGANPEDFTYKAIRGNVTANVDPNYLDNVIRDAAKVDIQNGKITPSGSSIVRDPTDIRGLQNLYNMWKPVFAKGEMTPDEFLNFRQDLTNLSKFGRELTKSDELESVSRQIRHDLNSTYRDQIPGLSTLDENFAKQKQEYTDLSKGLIKNGELTDSAINKIANAAGKGKDLLLQRLEEIKPGITKKIQYLKAVEDIQQTAGQKVGAYTKAAVGGGGLVAGVATMNIPLIAGALAEMFFTQPDNVVKIIQAYKQGAVPLAQAVMEKLKSMGASINESPQKAFKEPIKLPKSVGLSIEDVSKNNPEMGKISESLPTEANGANREQLTVYRGSSPSEDILSKENTNKTIYTSTSRDIASSFSGKQGIVSKYTIPKDSVVDINSLPDLQKQLQDIYDKYNRNDISFKGDSKHPSMFSQIDGQIERYARQNNIKAIDLTNIGFEYPTMNEIRIFDKSILGKTPVENSAESANNTNMTPEEIQKALKIQAKLLEELKIKNPASYNLIKKFMENPSSVNIEEMPINGLKENIGVDSSDYFPQSPTELKYSIGKNGIMPNAIEPLNNFPGKLLDATKFPNNMSMNKDTLASVWMDYKQGADPQAGDKLLSYLDTHPQEATSIASKSREIVSRYKYLYRVGDNTGLSWTPDKEVLSQYFNGDNEPIYKLKVTPQVLDRVIGHEDVLPYNTYSKYTPENEVLLKPVGKSKK